MEAEQIGNDIFAGALASARGTCTNPVEIFCMGTTSPIKYRINANAIKFSNLLAMHLERRNLLKFYFSDTQLCFIAQLLNFIETIDQSDQLQQKIIDFIVEYTQAFTLISFSSTVHIINYFDIPIAFNALISIEQPLPLPKTPAQEIEYNKQLVYIFNVAQQYPLTRESKHNPLWLLFGRMLYPNVLAYHEFSGRIIMNFQE